MAKVKIQDTWIDITNCKTEKEFVDVCYEVYGKPSVINVYIPINPIVTVTTLIPFFVVFPCEIFKV